MAVRFVAEARRSQVVSTFGVGSLFPSEDESFMIVGLDNWIVNGSIEVPEPRLARSLSVRTFRMPPAGGRGSKDLPVVRFPRIHHCPSCHRLDYINNFCSWDEHVCHDCQRYLVPSRFVVCCINGHIDDFPYYQWVHRGREDDAEGSKDHKLAMRTRGQSSSLDDIVISCACGVPSRSMAGSFGPQSLAGVTKCQGKRPWLRISDRQDCDKTPRTLQRGSSNVWFASVRSAISIPPWSEGVHRVLGKHWTIVQHIPADALETTLNSMGIPEESGLRVQDLVAAILEMRGETDSEKPTQAELRNEEYGALVLGRPELDAQQQFVCQPVGDLPAPAREYIDSVSEVSRLREVRALEGFTRVLPPDSASDSNRMAPLSAAATDWLPAVEVLGEGVFVRVNEARVGTWEESEFARMRVEAINNSFALRAATLGTPLPDPVSPRRLLLHSLAHVLLNELSLDAGYPVASLRERVYAEAEQAGILIYTASADSAGSLGGLSAQSEPERLWEVMQSAIQRAQWCSSDPVCIEAAGTGADALNLAACHACLLLPETSCEAMNHVLDRAVLVGTPSSPAAGFFADLMSH